MFNDEIDAVRIKAVNSLNRISHKVQLKEEQLHIVLSSLEDSCFEVRTAVHSLLKNTALVNITCLHATIQVLSPLENWKIEIVIDLFYRPCYPT